MEENLLVEKNDVISFIFEKFNCYNKDKLINITRNYYTESVILEAFKCLISAVPVKKSTRRCRRVKHPDPLIAIYDCIQLIPVADRPKFQYCNENNYPKISTNICNNTNKKVSSLCKKKPIKHEDDLVCSAENSPEKISFTKSLLIEELAVNRREQNEMKNKVCELSHMVKDLKNEIDNFMKSKELIPIKSEQSLLSKKDDSIILLQNLIDADNLDYDKDEILQSNPELDEDAYSLITDEQDEHHNLKRNFTQFTGNKVKRARPLFKSITSDLMEANNKIIVIKNDEETSDTQVVISSGDFYNPPVESSIEITSTDSFISHIEEVSATNDLIPVHFLSNINAPGGSSHYNFDSDKSTTKYKCAICEKYFSTCYELRQHCMVHISRSNFTCFFCERIFTKRGEFHQHFVDCLKLFKGHFSSSEYECNICSSFFAENRSLKIHMTHHDQAKSYVCNLCQYRFTKLSALEVHMKTHHNPQNTNQCLLCPLNFFSNQALMFHMANHTGEKPFRCKLCNTGMATVNKVRKHLATHGSQKMMQCRSCNKIIPCDSLSKHVKETKCNLDLVCLKCDKTFVTFAKYRKHCENHFEGVKYRCHLCLYSTSTKSSEIKHIKTHMTSVHKCPQCYVDLASRHNVSRHVKKYCKATLGSSLI